MTLIKNLLRWVAAGAILAGAVSSAQTYTNITAIGVQDGYGGTMQAGAICFSPYNSSGVLTPLTPSGLTSPSTGPFCGTVVNGVVNMINVVPNLLTVAPLGLNYQVTVYDQAANVITQLSGVTAVNGTNWAYSSYVVGPALITSLPSASGVGSPYLGCSVAANYTRTDISPMQNWACSTTASGYTQWQSNGTIPPVPGPNQAATIPVVLQMINDALSHFNPGGGGNPGGTQFQMQFNGGSGAFGGAKTTTDSTGNQLNTPILNGAYDAFKFQSSSGSNDGIAKAELAAGTNGVTVAGPNYPFVEQNTWNFSAANGTFHDYRMGGSLHTFVNPFIGSGQNNVQAIGEACLFDYNATTNGVEGKLCRNYVNQISGIGNDAGGGVTQTGGTSQTSTMVANGILAVDENVINCWKDGDCHAHRDTFSIVGINSDLSAESNGDFMPHYIQTPYLLVSHVNTVTDSTHIKVDLPNANGSYGTMLGGGWLVKQTNIDTGNITADSPGVAPGTGIVNRRFTTSTAHTPSAAWGYTTTVLNPPNNFITGDSTSVTVTKVGGTWPASGNVCISGDHTYETTFSGATDGPTVTMTIASRYEEPTGTTIVAGSCTIMFSNVDRLTNIQNGFITSEIAIDIVGAPDANTYFYTLTGVATRDQNALNGQYNWRTDTTINELAGVNVTRDASNNVLFPADSGNTGVGYQFMGARTITVAGCANSSFNFGPSPITITPNGNAFSLNFVQPGALLGAANTNGCTIKMSGLNGFTLHKAARVLSASDPSVPKNQFPYTGYYQLGVNTASFQNGDPVEQPTGNNIGIDAINEVAGMTPTNGGQGSVPVLDWLCHANGLTTAGICSGGMLPFRISNQAPWSQYIGGSGLYTPMNLANVSGVWGNYWLYGNAPANGGTYASFGCPPEGCTSPTPWNIFTLGGTFNGKVQYTPGTGAYSVNTQSFFTPAATFNTASAFALRATNGPNNAVLSFQNGSTQYMCLSFVNACANSQPDESGWLADGSKADPALYGTWLHGGRMVLRTLHSGFTYDVPCSVGAAVFDCGVGDPAGVFTTTGAAAIFTQVTSSGPVSGTTVTGSAGVGPTSTVLWTQGGVDPTGGCSTGALYSNVSGSLGHVLWACVGSAWVNVK